MVELRYHIKGGNCMSRNIQRSNNAKNQYCKSNPGDVRERNHREVRNNTRSSASKIRIIPFVFSFEYKRFCRSPPFCLRPAKISLFFMFPPPSRVAENRRPCMCKAASSPKLYCFQRPNMRRDKSIGAAYREACNPLRKLFRTPIKICGSNLPEKSRER